MHGRSVARGTYIKVLEGLSLRLATGQSLPLRAVGTKSGPKDLSLANAYWLGVAKWYKVYSLCTANIEDTRGVLKGVAPKAEKRTWILGVSARENIAKLGKFVGADSPRPSCAYRQTELRFLNFKYFKF